jgi:hypothetical protein
MSGAIHPLPQYAFMAWCLVKTQGQLYLYIYLRKAGCEEVNSKELVLDLPKFKCQNFITKKMKLLQQECFDQVNNCQLFNKENVTMQLITLLFN